MYYSSILTYYDRMYEPKFFMGALAAAMSEQEKLGYLADYPIYGMVSNINAFAMGARMINPRAKIYLKWTGLSEHHCRKELEQESRHLGLDFSRSKETEGLDMLAGLLEEHVDWELLLSTIGLPLPAAAVEEKSVLSEPGKLHISVARNEESFSFLYAEHLDILRRMGTVTFFNPEQDRAIPQETDLLYLPGGYPENRLEELAGARLARESIRSYIEAGGRTLAECGGMIYLSQSVLSDGDTDGGSAGSCVGNIGNEMVGVLPFSITNERKRRKLTLGYRRFDYNGWRLKGHEFHYTQFAVPETDGKEGGACSLPLSIAQVYNAKGGKVTTPVFRYKNLIASYTHLYWGEVDVMALFGEL